MSDISDLFLSLLSADRGRIAIRPFLSGSFARSDTNMRLETACQLTVLYFGSSVSCMGSDFTCSCSIFSTSVQDEPKKKGENACVKSKIMRKETGVE